MDESEHPPLRQPARRPSYHYHTFPTPPPKSAGSSGTTSPRNLWRRAQTGSLRPASPSALSARSVGSAHSNHSNGSADLESQKTPLPTRQLLLLGLLSLLEQTALNSLAPYLPSMVASFPGVGPDRIGLYVGILGSSFALAQLATNLGWGYLSDMHGRKPILLIGMTLLGFCFAGFGLCTRYWHALLINILMGLTNGNAAVVPAVFGELTDRSNQTAAFKWLPILYTVGSITGPGLGGLLVGLVTPGGGHPYLLPNLVCAILLVMGAVVLGLLFEETRPADELLPLWRPACVAKASAWLRRWRLARGRRKRRQSWGARWPRGDIDAHQRRGLVSADTFSDSDGEGEGDDASIASSRKDSASRPTLSRWQSITARSGLVHRMGDLLSPTTAVLLITLFFFHMSMVSFNSLFPIFAASPPPTGRGLSPGDIGGLLSVSGIATAVFQLFAYEPLKRRLGNLGTYRASLLGFVVSMALMPWVGYTDDRPWWGLGTGEAWLNVEMGIVLVVKNFAAVAGLASVMLLVTNSAPSSDSLGTLNGVAYTLAAAGRGFGPFFSGGLFTLSMGIHPKGEALAWGIFGFLALVGWLCTLAVRGNHLESDDYVGESHDDDPEHSRQNE